MTCHRPRNPHRREGGAETPVSVRGVCRAPGCQPRAPQGQGLSGDLFSHREPVSRRKAPFPPCCLSVCLLWQGRVNPHPPTHSHCPGSPGLGGGVEPKGGLEPQPGLPRRLADKAGVGGAVAAAGSAHVPSISQGGARKSLARLGPDDSPAGLLHTLAGPKPQRPAGDICGPQGPRHGPDGAPALSLGGGSPLPPTMGGRSLASGSAPLQAGWRNLP